MMDRKIGHKIFFIAAIGLSIILLFAVIGSSLIGYEIKTQCQGAQQQYGGDCIEALSSLLGDEAQSYRSRNLAIWALGQLGDGRPLSLLKKDYTGNIPSRESYDEDISQYELSKAIKLLEGSPNLFSWTWRWNIDITERSSAKAKNDTVILCEKADPYYSLAEKISAEENIDIIHSPQEIQKYHTQYILMVGAPQYLSEEKVIKLAQLLKSTGSYPALGIITGSTIDIAENLYRLGNQVTAGENYIGSDKDTKTNIDRPLIIKEGSKPRQEIELTEQSLVDTLKFSDYLYWARHSSATRWRWNSENGSLEDENCLMADEVPPLKPVIIHTPSCGSLHPWKENSIALAFIDQGAAAYIGHLHSPFNSGIFIGHAKYLPGKYTWKDFPVGMMVQVQNNSSARAVYDTPLFFMIGDPRMYLEDDIPYEIISDETYQDKRIIKATTDKEGIIPVKIDGGAIYSFISIDGVSKASDMDPFNNTSIQTLNYDKDKYILFVHPGGEFHMELAKKPPVLWSLTDPVIDSFDFSWVVIGAVFSPLSIVFLAILLLVLYFGVIRKRRNFKEYLPVFIFALSFSLLHAIYVLWRTNDVTVMNYEIDYGLTDYALCILGIFSTLSAGMVLMKNARRTRGVIAGLLLAVLPQLLLSGFYIAEILYINTVFQLRCVVSMNLWNYGYVIQQLIVLCSKMLVVIFFDYQTRKGRSA